MWRMQSGNRVLTEAEWALFSVGLDSLWDFIEDDRKEDTSLSETGVDVFDVLQPEQKLALLADVAQALRDPAIPRPRHTAANEGAIAAVFATLRLLLDSELDLSEDDGSTTIRSLLLAAAADSDEQVEELPEPTATDRDDWEVVLECIEGEIFWDSDYAMGDAFLDRPPEEARELLARMTIDPEYYTAIPREPDKAGLIAVRQTLARLLGRPVPNDDGHYSALEDLCHGLTVGRCSEEDVEAYVDHPWIEVISMAVPDWDCDLATWVTEFQKAIPTTPFTLKPAAGPATPGPADDWPQDVRIEQHGEEWVLRDGDGHFWCEVLANCWTRAPDEGMPILTFPSREEAEAAYRQANQMYAERAARRATALKRLGLPPDDLE
jgi:hypothetical protein